MPVFHGLSKAVCLGAGGLREDVGRAHVRASEEHLNLAAGAGRDGAAGAPGEHRSLASFPSGPRGDHPRFREVLVLGLAAGALGIALRPER